MDARTALLGLALAGCLACKASSEPPPSYPLPPPPQPVPVAVEEDAPPTQEISIAVDGDTYADTDPGALSDFRAALDPHGRWLEDDSYGTVWVPSPDEVGQDFTPYVTAGHWVYDDDYAWVSDYDWGWAPFHYGRWAWTGLRGWVWIPGRVYAGAWVSWRIGDDDEPYVGWAPMPPTWIWRGGIAVGIGWAPWAPYVFCPRADIFAPTLAPRVVRAAPGEAIAVRTRPYVQGGGARTPASPIAQVPLRGPPPASLHVDASRVVRPPAAQAGLLRAQQFARPSTARPLGARPAVPHVVRAKPIVMPSVAPRRAVRVPGRVPVRLPPR